MKKIIRLTESDLTRIVKRVIEEQKTQPIVDAGKSRTSTLGWAILFSQPTVTGGSGYKGEATAQVKFNGIRFNDTGNILRKGPIVLYASCGSKDASKNPGGGTTQNPANLSPVSSADIYAGGSTYVFSKGGVVDKAVRAFCASKGQPNSQNAGGVMDVVSGAKKAMELVK